MTTDEERWERIEAKRARNAYFRSLEQAAKDAARRKPVRYVTATPKKPKPRPEPKPRVVKPRPTKPRRKGVMGRPQTRPDNCVTCGRPMRDGRQKIADFPGTVPHGSRGECRTCVKGERPIGRQGRPKTRPDNCRDCDRPFRPRGAKVADHPGTVYYWGNGLCRTCREHPKNRG
jgi:hypothetical protein